MTINQFLSAIISNLQNFQSNQSINHMKLRRAEDMCQAKRQILLASEVYQQREFTYDQAKQISQLPSQSKKGQCKERPLSETIFRQGIRVPLTAVLTSMDAALVTQMKQNHIISMDHAYISAKAILMGHESRKGAKPRTL